MTLVEFLRALRPVAPEGAAAERWRQINERAEREGCKCGAPGTVVHYYGPAAIWSCREHEGVNQWSHDGERWIPVRPTEDEADSLRRWETVAPRPYNSTDAVRGGAFELHRPGA